MRNAPYLQVKVSPAFKKAVDTAAEAAGLDMSSWVRLAMANACGYDLNSDDALDSRGRPPKYKSEKERKAARARAQSDRAAKSKAVVAVLMRRERLADRAALEKWLADRGISLDSES